MFVGDRWFTFEYLTLVISSEPQSCSTCFKRSPTMSSHGHATLADLASEAGAGTELINYLEDRGIRAPATLALLAHDDGEFDSIVLQPLLTGWKTKAGGVIQLAEAEKPIAKAILRHMWNLARTSWKSQQAASLPATLPPDPSTTTTTTSSHAKDEKVPKTLPAGVRAKAIQHYESLQIGGCDRAFPTQELLGAESVLARIRHELTVSKLFTPVALAKKESKSTTFTVSNDQLVAAEEQVWQPRSLLSILDGLSSIRWAYVLLLLVQNRVSTPSLIGLPNLQGLAHKSQTSSTNGG